MRYLAWEEKYSVGVALIDDQHKVFIGIINELYTAIVEKETQVSLDALFGRLIEYTQFHFATEEKYFDEFHYAGAEEHRAAHKAMCDQVVAFQNKKGDILANPFELMDFLEDWLINHIMGMDKLFGPCFNEHGLK